MTVNDALRKVDDELKNKVGGLMSGFFEVLLGLPVFGWSDAPATSTVAARVAVAGSGTGTGPCSWEIRLNSIFYDGDDVGEDLRFEITADLVRQQASGRPTQRVTTPPRPFRHRQRYGFHGAGLLVCSGRGGECGDTTVVPIVIVTLLPCCRQLRPSGISGGEAGPGRPVRHVSPGEAGRRGRAD